MSLKVMFMLIHHLQVRRQISLWHHLHRAATQTQTHHLRSERTAPDTVKKCDGNFQRESETRERVLTHFISKGVKRRPVINMRRGMVRMRTKGSAKEKGLIFTAHRTARHTTWTRVKRCIRSVFTCTGDGAQSVN